MNRNAQEKSEAMRFPASWYKGKNDVNINEDIMETEKDVLRDISSPLPSGALQVNMVQF